MPKQMPTNQTAELANKYIVKFVLLAILAFMASGCASILNPYEENFSCRAPNGGRCVSISNAYEESTGERIAPPRPEIDSKDSSKKTDEPKAQVSKGSVSSEKAQEECKGDKDCIAKVVAERAKAEAEASYRVASQNKMARMLREPVTPLVAPPTVLRVLILPYQDEDSGLNLMRYTYIMVDKPKWIMGDYLNEGVNPQ